MDTHFALIRTVEPAVEPLTRAQAKAWLRVDADDSGQDDVIDRLIAAARRRFEVVAQRAAITQTWRQSLDRFPGDWHGWYPWRSTLDVVGRDPRAIRLLRPPLQSVTSITYVAADGTTTTLSASAYQVDVDSEPGRILPAWSAIWPCIRPTPGAVKVTFVAGYGASVPEDIAQALLAHVAYCWRVREEQDTDFLDSLFRPFAVGGMG